MINNIISPPPPPPPQKKKKKKGDALRGCFDLLSYSQINAQFLKTNNTFMFTSRHEIKMVLADLRCLHCSWCESHCVKQEYH